MIATASAIIPPEEFCDPSPPAKSSTLRLGLEEEGARYTEGVLGVVAFWVLWENLA
jgi:hypothetical protein